MPSIDKKEVEERLIRIIRNDAGFGDDVEIYSTTKFEQDLGTDSMDIAELVIYVEEEFDLDIPDADYEKFVTFGDAVNYIVGKAK